MSVGGVNSSPMVAAASVALNSKVLCTPLTHTFLMHHVPADDALLVYLKPICIFFPTYFNILTVCASNSERVPSSGAVG